ncbi:MAG: uracil-DNA glycosylase [Flavobacteriaceae bacterium]|nr:MAG: uracil-DNA glycosylase [Flavobacteriaceae bacterium]
MEIQLAESWKAVLFDEMEKEYFKNLTEFIDEAYESSVCYPSKEQVFAAFDHCSFDDLKVVLIGQDPYHGKGQANGLCFSVNTGIAIPPSLLNIFKELRADLGQEIPGDGNLERWAKQGVLLLNATLTVEEGNAGSHQKKGWEQFTDQVIKTISEQKKGLVFLLWGGYAKKKGKKIDRNKHLVLESGHPSPLSANRGYWFENRHFSACNTYLKNKAIDW